MIRAAGHQIRSISRALAPIEQQKWRCECGQWEGSVPQRGPFNSTSARARLGVVYTAHEKHVRAALKAKAS